MMRYQIIGPRTKICQFIIRLSISLDSIFSSKFTKSSKISKLINIKRIIKLNKKNNKKFILKKQKIN